MIIEITVETGLAVTVPKIHMDSKIAFLSWYNQKEIYKSNLESR
jgi:hypothetical protein